MNTDPDPSVTPAPPAVVPGTHCELMVLVSTLVKDHPGGDIYSILDEALLQTVDARHSLCEAGREQLLEVVCQVPLEPTPPPPTPQ